MAKPIFKRFHIPYSPAIQFFHLSSSYVNVVSTFPPNSYVSLGWLLRHCVCVTYLHTYQHTDDSNTFRSKLNSCVSVRTESGVYDSWYRANWHICINIDAVSHASSYVTAVGPDCRVTMAQTTWRYFKRPWNTTLAWFSLALTGRFWDAISEYHHKSILPCQYLFKNWPHPFQKSSSDQLGMFAR